MPDTDLMDTEEAAKLMRVEPAMLARWRVKKCGPAWLKLGRGVRYRRKDIEAYMAAATRDPAAASPPAAPPVLTRMPLGILKGAQA